MASLQRIIPCLWFDSEAEEAAHFYVSVFKNARMGKISRYGEEGFEIHGRPEGSVMTVEFEIVGQNFAALNGGPHFQFNEAISFQIPCETREQIDHYWERLSAGGEIQQCGWLKDRFGVSWQIFPAALPDMMRDSDKAKAAQAMHAMLGMKKFDIAELRAAYDGEIIRRRSDSCYRDLPKMIMWHVEQNRARLPKGGGTSGAATTSSHAAKVVALCLPPVVMSLIGLAALLRKKGGAGFVDGKRSAPARPTARRTDAG